MFNLLYYLKIEIVKFLIPFIIKCNALNLLSLLFILHLSKLRKISPKKKSKYKVIVLSKSGGIDDLIESQKKYNHNFTYLSCSREFFRIIYSTFMKTKDLDEKKFFSKIFIEKRKKYLTFLISFLKTLKKNYNFNGMIVFNFNYLPEVELHEACEKLKIPCLLLFKESVYTDIQNKYRTFFLKKNNFKFKGYKVAVYSDLAKKFLINSGICKENKIKIVGCSRLNKSFLFRKKIPSNQIVYYAIEKNRGIPTYHKVYGKKYFKSFKHYELYNPNKILERLHSDIVQILKEFANKNFGIKIIIKIKVGDKNYKKLYKNLPNNINIQYANAGHDLLEKPKIVIAWNTTSILEAIAANRFIILPYFFKKNKKINKRDELILSLKKENYAKTKKDFINKLNLFVEKKYNPKINYNNHKSLKYYLGNSDNFAQSRLNKFLKTNLFIK